MNLADTGINVTEKEIDSKNNHNWNQIWSDEELGIDACNEVLESAKKIDYKKGIAESHINRGFYYYHVENSNNSLEEFQKALSIYKDINNREGEYRSLTALGIFYEKIDMLDTCLEYRTLAYKLSEKLNDNSSMAGALSNLGEVYFRLQKYNQALDYYLKGLEIVDKQHHNYSAILCNIGRAYIGLEDYNSPVKYLETGIDVVKENGPFLNYTYLLSTMGQVYHYQKKSDKAESYFFQALKLAEKHNFHESHIDILLNLGKHYFESGIMDKADKYLTNALEISLNSEISVNLSKIYDLLYKTAKLEMHTDKALDYLEKLRDIDLNIFNSGINNKLSALTADHNYRQTVQENEIYSLKNVELKQSYETLSSLSTIGKKITSILDTDKLVEEMYQGIKSIIDLTVFGLVLVNKEKKQLDYKYFRAENEIKKYESISFNNKSSFFVSTIMENKEIILSDFNPDDPEHKYRKFNKHYNDDIKIPKSMVFLPLNSDTETIGGLTVQSYEENKYNEQHIEMLRILGTYIVSAIQNSLAHQEVNKLNKLLSSEKDELIEANNRIKHLANHDILTGLPNRRLFMQLLDYEIKRSARNDTKFALLFLDLDNFKPINDTYGHKTGDDVLIKFSEIVRKKIRKSDVMTRIGGDEFIILLSDVKNTNASRKVAEKIIESVSEKLIIENNTFNIGVSMGISHFPEDSLDSSDLVMKADKAMYEAKKEKNSYIFYSEMS